MDVLITKIKECNSKVLKSSSTEGSTLVDNIHDDISRYYKKPGNHDDSIITRSNMCDFFKTFNSLDKIDLKNFVYKRNENFVQDEFTQYTAIKGVNNYIDSASTKILKNFFPDLDKTAQVICNLNNTIYKWFMFTNSDILLFIYLKCLISGKTLDTMSDDDTELIRLITNCIKLNELLIYERIISVILANFIWQSTLYYCYEISVQNTQPNEKGTKMYQAIQLLRQINFIDINSETLFDTSALYWQIGYKRTAVGGVDEPAQIKNLLNILDITDETKVTNFINNYNIEIYKLFNEKFINLKCDPYPLTEPDDDDINTYLFCSEQSVVAYMIKPLLSDSHKKNVSPRNQVGFPPSKVSMKKGFLRLCTLFINEPLAPLPNDISRTVPTNPSGIVNNSYESRTTDWPNAQYKITNVDINIDSNITCLSLIKYIGDTTHLVITKTIKTGWDHINKNNAKYIDDAYNIVNIAGSSHKNTEGIAVRILTDERVVPIRCAIENLSFVSEKFKSYKPCNPDIRVYIEYISEYKIKLESLYNTTKDALVYTPTVTDANLKGVISFLLQYLKKQISFKVDFTTWIVPTTDALCKLQVDEILKEVDKKINMTQYVNTINFIKNYESLFMCEVNELKLNPSIPLSVKNSIFAPFENMNIKQVINHNNLSISLPDTVSGPLIKLPQMFDYLNNLYIPLSLISLQTNVINNIMPNIFMNYGKISKVDFITVINLNTPTTNIFVLFMDYCKHAFETKFNEYKILFNEIFPNILGFMISPVDIYIPTGKRHMAQTYEKHAIFKEKKIGYWYSLINEIGNSFNENGRNDLNIIVSNLYRCQYMTHADKTDLVASVVDIFEILFFGNHNPGPVVTPELHTTATQYNIALKEYESFKNCIDSLLNKVIEYNLCAPKCYELLNGNYDIKKMNKKPLNYKKNVKSYKLSLIEIISQIEILLLFFQNPDPVYLAIKTEIEVINVDLKAFCDEFTSFLPKIKENWCKHPTFPNATLDKIKDSFPTTDKIAKLITSTNEWAKIILDRRIQIVANVNAKRDLYIIQANLYDTPNTKVINGKIGTSYTNSIDHIQKDICYNLLGGSGTGFEEDEITVDIKNLIDKKTSDIIDIYNNHTNEHKCDNNDIIIHVIYDIQQRHKIDYKSINTLYKLFEDYIDYEHFIQIFFGDKTINITIDEYYIWKTTITLCATIQNNFELIFPENNTHTDSRLVTYKLSYLFLKVNIDKKKLCSKVKVTANEVKSNINIYSFLIKEKYYNRTLIKNKKPQLLEYIIKNKKKNIYILNYDLELYHALMFFVTLNIMVLLLYTTEHNYDFTNLDIELLFQQIYDYISQYNYDIGFAIYVNLLKTTHDNILKCKDIFVSLENKPPQINNDLIVEYAHWFDGINFLIDQYDVYSLKNISSYNNYAKIIGFIPIKIYTGGNKSIKKYKRKKNISIKRIGGTTTMADDKTYLKESISDDLLIELLFYCFDGTTVLVNYIKVLFEIKPYFHKRKIPQEITKIFNFCSNLHTSGNNVIFSGDTNIYFNNAPPIYWMTLINSVSSGTCTPEQYEGSKQVFYLMNDLCEKTISKFEDENNIRNVYNKIQQDFFVIYNKFVTPIRP